MLVVARALVDLVTSADLRRLSERKLQRAAAPFAGHIRQIGIFLRDVNGPRGGVDKRCTVIAKLERGGSIEIEETSPNFSEAIRRAARRLQSLLSRRITSKRSRRTVRGEWGVA